MYVPNVQPVQVPPMKVRVGAQQPAGVAPVQVPAFGLNLSSNAPDIAFDSFHVDPAILKIGMFVPTVIPLQEPPPPPPSGGQGIHANVAV
jgi:hypothetical protein